MSTFDLVPMLRSPEVWPGALVATIAMLALAGLDLVVAFAAREWADRRSPATRARLAGGLQARGANDDDGALA